MRLCLYLSVLILVSISCGKKEESISLGESKKEDLFLVRGNPQSEESIPVKDSSLVVYSENESYQIKNGIVTASLKSPASEENSVMFWKHKLKECLTKLNKLEDKTSHGPARMELDCPSEGLKIVYMEGSEKVLKVVQYAKN